MTNCVAFIFARGGSKGIPHKNIVDFCGKPLIAWAIEHCQKVPHIKRIIVSTDSLQIADVARAYGAEVPFLRPKELSTDISPEWLSWQHAIHFLRDTDTLPDVFVSVPTTSPLRSPLDIINCIDLFNQKTSDVVITVTDSHRSPYFNMVCIDDNQYCLLPFSGSEHYSRRQDVPVVWDMTTVAYVANPYFVLESSNLFEGRVKSVYVPPERAIDIDSSFDLSIAQHLFKLNQQ